jgi:putative transcriptional regulator
VWAHELAAPEPGCLLLASPDHFGAGAKDAHYGQAVILLVQHNVNGSVGFVLNRPTQFKIGAVTTGLEQFERCPLYWGEGCSP